MATFAVLFGTRHIDATEHQEGLIVAVAAESLVKLAAFLAVGFFVIFSMFGGIGGFLERIQQDAEIQRIFAGGFHGVHLADGDVPQPGVPSSCCRASSTSRWSRTTPRRRSAAPPGCSRSTWC